VSGKLADDGICLLLKGMKVEDELAAAAVEWAMAVDRVPSATGADGVVLRVAGLRRQ
jgi:16S rRNA (guanine527-N7)-methyltransferase